MLTKQTQFAFLGIAIIAIIYSIDNTIGYLLLAVIAMLMIRAYYSDKTIEYIEQR